TAYIMRQDEKGYLWIGTDNGGVRFDGKTFKELQPIHRADNPEILECTPLSDNRIACIPITGDIYILDHDTVINSVKLPALGKKIPESHNSFSYDPASGVACLWEYSIKDFVYKIEGRGLKRLPNKATRFSLDYCAGNDIIGTDSSRNCVGAYNIVTGRIQAFYHRSGSTVNSLEERLLPPIANCNKLLTYEAERQQLHVYERNKEDSVVQEINRFVFPITLMFSSFISSCNRAGRQYFFYRMPDKHVVYCEDITDRNALENLLDIYIPGLLKNFFVDDHNNVWISSSDNALYFVSEKHINNARRVAGIGLKSGVAKSISGIGRRLCISYPNSNILTYYTASGPRHFRLNDEFSPGPRNIETLSDSNIYFYEGDIGILHPQSNTISYLQIRNRSVKDICLYRSGLLAATHADVVFFEKARGKYTRSTVFEGRSTVVQSMAGGEILVGTPEGLYRKEGLHAPPIRIDAPVWKKQYVTDILFLDDNNALIGTHKGLFVYGSNGSVRKLSDTVKNGFVPPHIRHLYRQDSSILWAATDEGACMLVFDRKWQLQSVHNYTFYDGLPSNNVTSIYTWQDTAYIATADGLGIVPIKDTGIPALAAPRLYIDRLQVGHHTISIPGLRVTLPNDSNELRMVLSAISYESIGNIQYYYRLSPLQKEWIKTAEPEARFSRLPPGSYVFEAYALNAKGVKSKTVRLELSVPPAYWQTVYFRAGLTFLALAGFFILIRWQLRRSEKKRYIALQQKKHMAELELEAIKAQINPHFISNCLNSIQYLNYTTDYEGAQRYLGRFARLIRMTLQYSRKVFISVEEEIAYLSEYLQMEQLRLKKRLRYVIENELEGDTMIPAMLLQPYVENALKHGLSDPLHQGLIKIMFSKSGENLAIKISDNGPGFSDGQSAESMGLRLSSTKALSYSELFNMKVTIQCSNRQESEPGNTGAVVRIIIKSNKKWKNQLPAQSS
ncbi:MAG: histidine kinase, partial [Chitinophagaceae bacterium]|nr:histidine kinase [Chitinophagaceae bacterium]